MSTNYEVQQCFQVEKAKIKMVRFTIIYGKLRYNLD